MVSRHKIHFFILQKFLFKADWKLYNNKKPFITDILRDTDTDESCLLPMPIVCHFEGSGGQLQARRVVSCLQMVPKVLWKGFDSPQIESDDKGL